MKSSKPDAALTKALATIANLSDTTAPLPLDEMRKRVEYSTTANGNRRAEIEFDDISWISVSQQVPLSGKAYYPPRISWPTWMATIEETEQLAMALLVLVEIAKEWDKDTGKEARTNAAT